MNYEYEINRLKKSKFRREIGLNEDEIEKIKEEAFEILARKIRVKLKNDGRQTPWRGHPVFPAMHATATCCRKCIKKWHNLTEEKKLTDEEIGVFSNLIFVWMSKTIH